MFSGQNSMRITVTSVLLLFLCIFGVKSQSWRKNQRKNEWNSNSISNCPLQTHRNPESYWHVDNFGRRYLRRCPHGQAFFAHKCSCDHTPPPCDLRASDKSPRHYEQYSNGYWIEMMCADGTAFNSNTCLCSTFI
ncbi:uncharacterized protein [Mytilus edulis]|uniref:uncharacterized protein n=1 Tax=Mytilus edulis TaxID=6550 RepID=UPI0039EED5A8